MLGWSKFPQKVGRSGANSERPDSQTVSFYFSLAHSHDCICADFGCTNLRPNRDREKVFRGGRCTRSPRSGTEKLQVALQGNRSSSISDHCCPPTQKERR